MDLEGRRQRDQWALRNSGKRGLAIEPGSRWFLLDLDATRTNPTPLLASACKALRREQTPDRISYVVEGVEGTPAIVLFNSLQPPRGVTLAGKPLSSLEFSPTERLLWIRFEYEALPRELAVHY